MISDQVLQSTLDGIKEITGTDFALFTATGRMLAGTTDKPKITTEELMVFAKGTEDERETEKGHLFRIPEDSDQYCFLLTEGSADSTVGRLVAYQIRELLVAYREKLDRDSFIKNLLLDNLLLVDIYNRARRLHIDTEKDRIVYILETAPERELATVDNLKNRLENQVSDFITAIDEKNIILVHELNAEGGNAEAQAFAEDILVAAGAEKDSQAHVAYGTIVHELKDVSRSFKEARMALDIGKIFFDRRNVIAYSSLGIGRLIYQLPIPLCKIFIKEIFSQKSPDDFDEETLTTINKFFENNLNVSETSRQLFIHRNTLVYRLDKLQKSTGLDLRVFEDAITFKIALMVVKYMKYMETLEY